jgi:hypothetical protein
MEIRGGEAEMGIWVSSDWHCDPDNLKKPWLIGLLWVRKEITD